METKKLSFNSIFLSQFLVLIPGLFIWSHRNWEGVKLEHFGTGLLIGIFSAFGKNFNAQGMVIGYAGVAGTIASLNGPLTVVIDCIKL